MLKKIVQRVLACWIIGMALASCGQKGPLTLPQPEPSEQSQKSPQKEEKGN